MSFGYIKLHYNVPACIGRRVTCSGKPGIIVGTINQYIEVLLDGDKYARPYHPTWEVVYGEIGVVPKTPKSRSRYEEYRHSEVVESFPEWLGIDLPRREYNYYGKYEERDYVRLTSSRGTGEYCKTLKDAKASYKADMARRKAEDKAYFQNLGIAP